MLTISISVILNERIFKKLKIINTFKINNVSTKIKHLDLAIY